MRTMKEKKDVAVKYLDILVNNGVLDYVKRDFVKDDTIYYSENGNSWTKIGSDVSLEYSLGMFVGYRFGLFNYATKTAGGYVDFDWFKIGRNVSEEIYLDDEEPIPQEQLPRR